MEPYRAPFCKTHRDTVSAMATAVSVRLDEEATRALAQLEAIRHALVRAADEQRGRGTGSWSSRARCFRDNRDRRSHLDERPSRVVSPEIELDYMPTKVLVEQLAAVDVSRLGALVGHTTPEELWGVDEALRTVLALR